MYVRRTLLAAVLAALAGHAAAELPSPVRTGALPVPANHIVGLWTTQAAVKPCGSNLPLSPIRNTILFHAGGTWEENTLFPPAGAANVGNIPGIHQRGQALGTWSYNPLTRQYTGKLRFDWFVDDTYHGYSTVDRVLTLSNDGQQAAGPVSSARYAANGSKIGEVCGSAVSTRL